MINFTFSFVFALHLFCHTKDIYFIVCVCGRERDRKGETEILKSISNISFSLSPYHLGSSLSLSATAITCDNIFQTFCCL